MINIDSKISISKDIDVSDLDGEVVMMNIEKGSYLSLNSVGSDIWNSIKEKTSVKDIVNNLLTIYKVDRSVCEQSVLNFLIKLENEGIIIVA